MDVVMQRLREVLTAAGKIMRCGSEDERRKAAELLRACAGHCSNEKVALHLKDMADELQDGDSEMFWGDWYWTWGYWEALTDVAAERER
jgi:hypothetical protein